MDCRAIITRPKYTQIPITEESFQVLSKDTDGSKLEIQGSNKALQQSPLATFRFSFSVIEFRKFFPLHSSFNSSNGIGYDLDHLSQSRPLQWNLELFQDEEPTALFAAANDLSPVLEFETRNLQIQIKDDLGVIFNRNE